MPQEKKKKRKAQWYQLDVLFVQKEIRVPSKTEQSYTSPKDNICDSVDTVKTTVPPFLTRLAVTKMKALWRPPADYYMDMHSTGMEKTYIKNKWQKVAGQTLWGDGYSISIPMVLTWVYLVKYLSCTLECGFYVLYAVCALSMRTRRIKWKIPACSHAKNILFSASANLKRDVN